MQNDIYDELVNGILSAISDGVVDIILYGSVARGTNNEESDIDVAVIVLEDLTTEQSDVLSDFIVDMNLKYDKVFSVIDINNEKFENWKNVLPFYKNVACEGVSLWKAA
ncbi:MAG: nucleotidyltransferase domain-containing protein [Pseudobutyrivibrio sp.]|mgnify:FL=1|nr:nucleotidyltransferase domain-containing protein [Pseudobutyrivibrio sp.]